MGHTMHTHLIGNAEMQMMKRVTRMRIPLPVAAGDVAIPLLLRKRVRIPMPVAAGGVAIPLLLRKRVRIPMPVAAGDVEIPPSLLLRWPVGAGDVEITLVGPTLTGLIARTMMVRY